MPLFTRATVVTVVLAVCVTLVAIDRPARPAEAQQPAATIEQVRVARVGNYIVEKHVLLDASAAADATAITDRVTGISSDGGDVTAQYVLNPWKWAASAMPVPVYYNPSLEAPRPSAASAIADAIAQWSAVSPASFTMTYAGTTTTKPGACDDTPDGINVVGYVTTLQPNVLGLTCSFRELRAPTTIVEFDMELAWGYDWGSGPTVGTKQYDLRSTILHEMGHAAGLGHSCVSAHDPRCTPAQLAAVMFPALAMGQMKRTLTDDDKAGLLAQYPPPPPPPGRPGIPVFDRFFALVAPGVSRE